MLAQSTIREGIGLAQSWGPVGVSLVGILSYALWNKVILRKHAFDPVVSNSKKIDRLFQKNDELFRMNTSVDKEVSKKITHADIDDKLVKYQLKEVCDTQFKAVESRLAHMENMLSEIHLLLVKRS